MADREHGRPTREEPLTPHDTKSPTHAERARTLVSSERTGTLATLNKDGFPHASYVTFAMHEGGPVFLVSTMASHTENLQNGSKASLMAHEVGADDPLSNGRVTMLGHCRPSEDPAVREAYLARHPGASYYVDFKDFGFYKLHVESIRYIGGYGRMSWVESEAWHGAEIDPLADAAEAIIEHMNDDHADALVAYAKAFTRANEAEQAQMTGIDRYGFEMSVVTERGPRPARIAFDEPIASSEEARSVLVALVKKARAKLA